jgi:hypothetical protein
MFYARKKLAELVRGAEKGRIISRGPWPFHCKS